MFAGTAAMYKKRNTKETDNKGIFEWSRSTVAIRAYEASWKI